MSRRCGSTSSQCAINLPATLCHGLRESGIAALDSVARAFVAFDADPYFCFADEPAQLLEHDSGGSTVALEHFDPLEPVDHRTGFVHPATVAMRSARECAAFVSACERARHRRGTRRMGTQTEDRFVEHTH